MDKFTKKRTTDGDTTLRSLPPMRSLGDEREVPVNIELGAMLAGRLQIGPLLGRGGMGNVYAARDHLKRQDVAIKVLRDDLSFSAAARDRFMSEARLSCDLSHPNIVRVYDVGVSGTHYFLSMERLKGQTLRQRIEARAEPARRFALEEVTDIATQLIAALRYAHRYIVHRDLKPENIWISEDGTVKLMDFGIARAYTSSQLTRTGTELGTAYYMAPEQRIASKEVDWRADQYSLGVVMYELLTGSIPIGAFAPLERERRDIPKRYARAVMRTMSPRAENRFPSLDAMLAELGAREPMLRLSRRTLALIGVNAVALAGLWLVVARDDWMPLLGSSADEALTTAAAALPAEADAAKQASTGTEPERKIATEIVTVPAIASLSSSARTQQPTPAGPSPGKEVVALNVGARAPATQPPPAEEVVVPKIKPAVIERAPADESTPNAKVELGQVPSDLRPLVAPILSAMVAIPGGQFRMGDLSGNGDVDEKPVRSVRVSSFRLSKYEVTARQFDEFLSRTKQPPRENAESARDDTPITQVSWGDAQAYIAWLNELSGLKFRLPTEAEWEYAARAGSTTSFYWGMNFDAGRANGRGVTGRDQWSKAAPVGSFAPNGYGLFDMSGNVWEWMQDCYAGGYDTAPSDGSASTAGGCQQRTMRGGGWFGDSSQLRTADRDGGVPTVRLNDLGFRLALD